MILSLVSVIVALVGWVYIPKLLALLDTPTEAIPLAIRYLRVIFIAMPIMFFLNFVMMALRGAGDSMTPLLFMGLSAIIDVVLNPVLILDLGPAPRDGHIRRCNGHVHCTDFGVAGHG